MESSLSARLRRTVPPGRAVAGRRSPADRRSPRLGSRATTMPCGLPPTLDRLGLLAPCGVDPGDGAVAAVRDPDGARPDGDADRARPTGIVVVTARVAGSMRTTASSSESATQTRACAGRDRRSGRGRPAIGVSSPVGSTRVTVFASLSVTQTAPAADARRPVGPAFGSIALHDLSVLGSSRESRPEDGSDPDGTSRSRRPSPARPSRRCRSGSSAPRRCRTAGSMRLTVTDALVGFEPTTQTAAGEVASPVGVSGDRQSARRRFACRGSTRATVWSSRFATQSEPDP